MCEQISASEDKYQGRRVSQVSQVCQDVVTVKFVGPELMSCCQVNVLFSEIIRKSREVQCEFS